MWRSRLASSALAASLAVSACSATSSNSMAGSGEPASSPPDTATFSGTRSATPYDEAAEFHPGLMRVQPEVAQPGELVGLRFAQGVTRGRAFALERRQGDGWVFLYELTSAAGSSPTPRWAPAGSGVWEQEDINLGDIEGHPPQQLVVPDVADPGQYRVCTTGRKDNLCAKLEVVAEQGS